ncbi:MAG: hypothetical protein JWM80_5970 [Cyanobacteria bacterium RYN_339]|nr:hypothetical protein [Cyanobacteria bacterium RYN_339]
MFAALLWAALAGGDLAGLTHTAHQLEDLAAARRYQDTALNTRSAAAKREAATALRKQVEAHGWPKAKADRADALWLALSLGTPEAETLDALARAAKAAAADDATLRPDAANLVDLACWADGKPQVYGFRTVQEGGGWKYYQIEEHLRVNERRAAMGLPAIDVEGRGMSTTGIIRLQALRRQILTMAQKDQAARLSATEAARAGRIPSWASVNAVDGANLEALKAIVSMHHWPGSDLVGTDGTHMFWLLITHMDGDRPFQLACLPMLEAAVKAKLADAADLAALQAHLAERR